MVAVVGGDRGQQRDRKRLQKELGIKNIVNIVFVDNPIYWEMAEEKGVNLGDFLKEHFETLTEDEYKSFLK